MVMFMVVVGVDLVVMVMFMIVVNGNSSKQPRTFGSSSSRLHAHEAFPKLVLRPVQLCKGASQVLELLVKLFLDLRQLLGLKGCEVDLFPHGQASKAVGC